MPYPDNMNHRHLDAEDPAVEAAHGEISNFAAKISEGVDALLASLRPNGIATMNEEPEELFAMLAEKYEHVIGDAVKALKDAEVDDPYECLLYVGIHRRKEWGKIDLVATINERAAKLRPVPTNPATPGFDSSK